MEPTLTVAQLIAALQAVEDQDATVIAEGCDCANPVVGVEMHDDQVWLSVRL